MSLKVQIQHSSRKNVKLLEKLWRTSGISVALYTKKSFIDFIVIIYPTEEPNFCIHNWMCFNRLLIEFNDYNLLNDSWKIDTVPSDIMLNGVKIGAKNPSVNRTNKKKENVTITITSVSLKNLIKCHKNKNATKSSENKIKFNKRFKNLLRWSQPKKILAH